MGVGPGLRQQVAVALARSWLHRGILARLLTPISLLYAFLVAMRRLAYQIGLFKAGRVDCTVLVVGNAIVGGAGKTPTTIAVVQHLQSCGLAVGVVSRGYGRQNDGVSPVPADAEVSAVGDEPLLIARATGVPVYVGRNRHTAATALLMQYPQTQVLVCDDGLQHFGLYRDIEVCVFDDRGAGNGWLLPAGPLREHWPRKALAQVGQDDARLLVLNTGSQPRVPGYSAQRTLDQLAVNQDGTRVALDSLQRPVLALAGIANPDAFFSALRAMGVSPEKTIALPDHFDFQNWDKSVLKGYEVLCTEKDAVKLWACWPQAMAVPLIQTLEPAFLAALDGLVDAVQRTKLSSQHGHQTA
jgi:tetraacyldisaccharide 4'-kinase